MKDRIRLVVVVAIAGAWLSGDLLACGDKFLVAGRGTRFQRPKNARAASVLIYANPSSGLPAALKNVKVESVLKYEAIDRPRSKPSISCRRSSSAAVSTS